MRRIVAVGFVAISLMACGTSQAPSEQPASEVGRSELAPTEVPESDAGAHPLLSQDASTAPEASQDAAPLTAPSVNLEPSKSWPFFVWDRAESYTFNLRRPGPGMKLRIYTEAQGWTETPTKGPQLSKAQAKTALDLLAKTEGQMIVSKCPFPRHGIVFFQGETPVGSISVCFECGDIMVWPAYGQGGDWEEQVSRRFAKRMKGYKRAFPRWEKLFESELSLATDWTKLPSR